MLAEWFGSDQRAMRFILDHAGIVIVLPPLDEARRLAAERHIKSELDRDPNSLNKLSDFYGISRRSMLKSVSPARVSS
jgi:predicted TIM-barrel fold metal-dependent hydrolase